MKRLIIAFVLFLAPAFALASAGGGVHLEDANIDLADKESLQRGAKYLRQLLHGLPFASVHALQPHG